MIRKVSIRGALSLALLLSAAHAVYADGFIYVDRRHHPPLPFPHPVPIPRPLPRPEFPMRVTRHRVEVRIDGTVARTRVEETFFNPQPSPLEGTYMFPLPAGASISRFAMSIGGKEVAGEILERDKARAIYEQIVRQSRDPGLLEFVERGLFRARVFPIPAQGSVEVRIEYEENLPLTGGVGRYRYPLNTGKYSAGDYQDVLIDVMIRAAASLRSVTCPSHSVSVTRPSEREGRVVFEAKSLAADRDFLLDWNVGEDALAPMLLTHWTHQPEGFFLLSIAPRPERPRSPPPKDLIAVIDTSGSMVGAKIDDARRALRHFVSALNPGDRFNLIDFSTEARRFREGLVEVNEEARRQALAYVDGFQARGGTNIEEALALALAALDKAGGEERLKLVVLITDGEPTVGITRPEDLARSIREKNARGRRIFVFGVGVDLNAQLLERLAQDHRGSLDYVLPGENLELKLSSFWDKIDFPVLTDVRIEFPNLPVSDLYPRPLPDLFRGEQLAVLGRFRDGGRRAVVVRGKFLGEERLFEYTLDFSAGASAGITGPNSFIPRLWAARKVGHLLEAIRHSGAVSSPLSPPEGTFRELKDEVIRLSQEYGILTPYTSYLILEEAERLRAAPALGASPPRAVEWAGVRVLRDSLAYGAPQEEARKEVAFAGRALKAEGGEAGVAASQAITVLNKALDSSSADRFFALVNRAERRVQQVGSRAFYLEADRWVQGGLEERDLAGARRVAYLSEEYFALLQKHPGIGEVLGVGPRVTFRWNAETITVE